MHIAVTLAGCLGQIEGVGGDVAPPNADPLAGCSLGCHGSDISTAPPTSIAGDTATTAKGVGAHQQHLNVAPTWHRQVACSDCHVVPQTVGAPGHIDGDNVAEVQFSALAGAAPAYTGTTCTAQCHGSTALGGTHPEPTWTQVDGSQVTCGSCHGTPPPAPHPQDPNCASCHPSMEEGSLTFRDPSLHINGVVDVADAAQTSCTACHGSPTSSAPPKDLSGQTAATAPGVGAHQAHLAPGSQFRPVTCSNCHVVPATVDSPGHRDGDNIAEVIFDTLNPAGTYTKANATCANQYCHGNGRGAGACGGSCPRVSSSRRRRSAWQGRGRFGGGVTGRSGGRGDADRATGERRGDARTGAGDSIGDAAMRRRDDRAVCPGRPAGRVLG